MEKSSSNSKLLLQHKETLKPITHWLIPERVQSVINNVSKEHTGIEKIKCFICTKSFANEFLRDFHLINIHNMHVSFTCKQCENSEVSDEDSIYFKSLYNYFAHLAEEHEEENHDISFWV